MSRPRPFFAWSTVAVVLSLLSSRMRSTAIRMRTWTSTLTWRIAVSNAVSPGAGKPSTDDMRLAAEWLEHYEGEGAEACARVAAWLSEQADSKDLRDAAREHGVPVS